MRPRRVLDALRDDVGGTAKTRRQTQEEAQGRPGVQSGEDPPASREDGSWGPGCSRGRRRGGRVSPALSAEHSRVHAHPWLLGRPSKPRESGQPRPHVGRRHTGRLHRGGAGHGFSVIRCLNSHAVWRDVQTITPTCLDPSPWAVGASWPLGVLGACERGRHITDAQPPSLCSCRVLNPGAAAWGWRAQHAQAGAGVAKAWPLQLGQKTDIREGLRGHH